MTSPQLVFAPSGDTLIWLAVTLILGGAAAFAAGRAVAQSWRGLPLAAFYAALLAGAACFLSYALFAVSAIPLQALAAALVEGEFLKLPGLLAVWFATFALLAAIAAFGWANTRRSMMAKQYSFVSVKAA